MTRPRSGPADPTSNEQQGYNPIRRAADRGTVCMLTTGHSAFDVRIFYKECRTLATAGFDVSFVVSHIRDKVVDGVRIVALPLRDRRVARMTVGVLGVLKAACRIDADVYHFHDPELIPVGILLRMMRRRVIYDVHEDVPDSMLSKPYFPHRIRPLVAKLTDLLGRWAGRCFTAIIPATPRIARRFERTGRPVVVVQNFPSLAEFRAVEARPWREREHAVAYVGNISAIRGVAQMVEAMGLLPPDFPATLQLGGGIGSDGLRQSLEALPGWRRVADLGFLTRIQIGVLLGNVRAGLVLLHPEPNYLAAYPTKMFEYMAAGLPVIASDFPLWRRIVEDAGCGLVVDPLDVRAVSEAVRWILTDDDAAEAMGRAGQEAVAKRYNWEAEAPKLLSLYSDVLGRG